MNVNFKDMQSKNREVSIIFTYPQSKSFKDEEHSIFRKCNDTVWTFLRTTTFPGVTQVSNSPSVLGKVLWLIMILFGGAFTIQQSYISIMEYFKYEVVERTTRQFDLSPCFPSVTVCSNALLNINQGSLAKQAWEHVLNKTHRQQNKLFYYTASKYRKALQLYFSTLSTSEKIAIGFSYQDLFLSCKYGALSCGGVVVTHSPIFGNCFTISSPWNGNKVSLDNTYEGLEVILNSPRDVYWNSSPAEGPMVYIHLPNTAPSFQSHNTITLYPTKWTTIKLKRSEVIRMKEPYSSRCIDGDDEARLQSYYYTDETPYEYSWDACVRSCLQKESYEKCGCYMRYIPLPPALNVSDIHFCGDDSCNSIRDLNNDVCKCRPRCNDVVYNFDVDVNDRMFTYGGLREIAKHYLLRHVKENEKPDLNDICGFTIYFGDANVEVVYEEAALSWATVLGSIGGNLGLWIGISIISFGEVLDLLMRLFYVIVYHLYLKCCIKNNGRIMNSTSKRNKP